MNIKPLVLMMLIVSCSSISTNTDDNENILTIAAGSCNDQDRIQPMWDYIIDDQPDVWIWLGDNIYGDKINGDSLYPIYDKQLANDQYQRLVSSASVIGTWDDHDYGINNGGKNHPDRKGSQEAFMYFLDIPDDHPMRRREGVYSSYIYEKNGFSVKVILLDSRYFRDEPIKEDGQYVPNNTGTVLGADQWRWLESELKNSNADIHLIGNGIQVIPEDHSFEKWSNFPDERRKLFQLIEKYKVKGAILLSGDRHVAEVSSYQLAELDYPLREITTSGLTHSYEEVGEEPNRHRISPLVGKKNYLLLRLEKRNDVTNVSVLIKGLNDTIFYQEKWMY